MPTNQLDPEQILSVINLYPEESHTAREIANVLSIGNETITVRTISDILKNLYTVGKLSRKEINKRASGCQYAYTLPKSTEVATSRTRTDSQLGSKYLNAMRGPWERCREIYADHRHFIPVQDGVTG